MKQKFISSKINIQLSSIFLVVTLLFASVAVVPQAFASTYLTKSSVIFTNMVSGGASSIIVEFTTSASNTGTNGQLVFYQPGGSAWTGSAGTGTVATSITPSQSYNSTNCKTITGASQNLPGSPTAAGTAGTGTISVTDASALTASTSYCYVLPSAITANPTSTGQGTIALTAGSDSATTDAFDIIGGDQVTVNASVPPTFTMSLSGSSDNLGQLSTGSVSGTTGITATINTNAKTGWYIWGSDSNGGLNSATEGYTIAATTPGTNATIASNSEGYVTGLPAAGITQGSGSGTTSATTAFASSGSGNGSGLSTTPQELAKSTGTASNAIVTVKEYAAIAGTTPAASDYTDTITLIGAGSF